MNLPEIPSLSELLKMISDGLGFQKTKNTSLYAIRRFVLFREYVKALDVINKFHEHHGEIKIFNTYKEILSGVVNASNGHYDFNHYNGYIHSTKTKYPDSALMRLAHAKKCVKEGLFTAFQKWLLELEADLHANYGKALSKEILVAKANIQAILEFKLGNNNIALFIMEKYVDDADKIEHLLKANYFSDYADFLSHEKKYIDAKKYYDAALKLYSDLGEEIRISKTLLNKAIMLIDGGEYGLAKEIIKDIIKVSVNNNDTYTLGKAVHNYGTIIDNEGKPRSALAIYKTALRYAKKEKDYYCYYCIKNDEIIALNKCNERETIRVEINKMLENQSRIPPQLLPELFFLCAKIAYENNELPLAERMYETAIKYWGLKRKYEKVEEAYLEIEKINILVCNKRKAKLAMEKIVAIYEVEKAGKSLADEAKSIYYGTFPEGKTI